MLTPGTIKKPGININGSTIPKRCKHEAPLIKNWIVQKRKHNQAVTNVEIIHNLKVMFNIAPCNEQKFPEIVQRIYNAIFVSVC